MITINYCELKLNDVANGPGVRVTLFVSGCTHHCEGCFNQVSWDFNAGEPFTEETEDLILETLSPPYISGLTILGGEPFEYQNQLGLLSLLKRVKKTYPKKSIWCYTGYLFDKEILDVMCNKWPETMEILQMLDVLVDGKFELDKKDLMLQFKGSSNQRTIDVPASLKSGEVVLLFK